MFFSFEQACLYVLMRSIFFVRETTRAKFLAIE